MSPVPQEVKGELAIVNAKVAASRVENLEPEPPIVETDIETTARPVPLSVSLESLPDTFLF